MSSFWGTGEVVGLAEADLVDDVWQDIVGVYSSVVKQLDMAEKERRWHFASEATRAQDGLRYGSIFTLHSKLEILRDTGKLIHFDFYANMIEREREYEEKYGDPEHTPAIVRQRFRERVTEYLHDSGLARTILGCQHG